MDSRPECDVCDDTGSITWQQPVRNADGVVVLTEMNHPCVRGCSGWRKMPTAEQGTVVDDPDALPMRTSNVAQANLHHRTDWSQPRQLWHPSPPGTKCDDSQPNCPQRG